ncbi:MAG: hypothetical protein JOS17DRAFT_755910 [Linnemannia elongata]|nr:MAG: hypothetical protein JOS17DRAFT_755910 [Linnemannia elongata]
MTVIWGTVSIFFVLGCKVDGSCANEIFCFMFRFRGEGRGGRMMSRWNEKGEMRRREGDKRDFCVKRMSCADSCSFYLVRDRHLTRVSSCSSN